MSATTPPTRDPRAEQDLESAADRSVGPEAPRHRLVDDGYRGGLRTPEFRWHRLLRIPPDERQCQARIRRLEIAAGDERNPERLEIAWRDDAVLGARALSGLIRLAFDLDPIPMLLHRVALNRSIRRRARPASAAHVPRRHRKTRVCRCEWRGRAKRQPPADVVDERDDRALIAGVEDYQHANASAIVDRRELIEPPARAQQRSRNLTSTCSR